MQNLLTLSNLVALAETRFNMSLTFDLKTKKHRLDKFWSMENYKKFLKNDSS